MVYFLKRLETSPFRWGWFCMYAIKRLGHAFCHTQNVFTKDTLTPTYSACSFAETLQQLLLHVFRAQAEHFRELICIVFCLSRMHNTSKSDISKFWHKHFGYSWEKSKRQCLLLLFFMNDIIRKFWEAIRISRTRYWFSWFSRTNTVES